MLLKVLITWKIRPFELDYLKSKLNSNVELIIPDAYSEEEYLKHIKEADVLLGDYISKKILEDGVNLKLLQVPQAGVNFVDFDLLSDYDIPICNTHSNAISVAEHAVALLLSIAKKIPYHDRLLRAGDWNRKADRMHDYIFNNSSDYVSNKNIGFIGYGNIGRAIGKMLNGFNPKISAIVNNKNKSFEELDFIGDFDDLDFVLENTDYLVIAAPLTDKTRGLLNIDKLKLMKKTSFIINISRGAIIDEDALYYVLKNRTIAGAAIDTWYNYKGNDLGNVNPAKNHDFSKFDNLIMSPHRAAYVHGEISYIEDAIENINRLSEGVLDFKNVINPKKGY